MKNLYKLLKSQKTQVKIFSSIFISSIFLSLFSCKGDNKNQKESSPNDSTVVPFNIDKEEYNAIQEYIQKHGNRVPSDLEDFWVDTVIGKFNGIDIDTLISVPVAKRDHNGAYHTWRVFSKNGTVKDLIIRNTVSCMFHFEGDLDLNGTDEFGIAHVEDIGYWFDYPVYTYDNGEWKYIYNPKNLNSNDYDIEYWNTMDSIIENTGRKNEIHLRVAGWDNDYSTPKDTIVNVNMVTIPQVNNLAIENLYETK